MTKKEQLKEAFKKILEEYIGNDYYEFTINHITEELIKEVEARTKI